jgi:hypothetical protein
MDKLYITHCLIESITKTHYGKKDLILFTTVYIYIYFFVLNEAGV